jgi:hypothetical protein
MLGFRFSCLAVLGFVVVWPPVVEGQARAMAQVAALVARYDSSWDTRNPVAVSRMLAPRYQYFTSRGGVSSRAQTMSFLSTPDYALDQAKRSELAVTLIGPVAVVSSRWQGQGPTKASVSLMTSVGVRSGCKLRAHGSW